MRANSSLVRTAKDRSIAVEDDEALDRPLRIGRSRTTPRELLARIRAAGLTPHTLGADEDETFAQRLHDVRAKKLATGAFRDGSDPEESVAVSSFLGVAEALCPATGSIPSDTFGDYAATLQDLAAMGIGRVRRMFFADLGWASLFPLEPGTPTSAQDGQEVPPPADMAGWVSDGDYACLALFIETAMAAYALGIKLRVTPFNFGGGAKYTLIADQADAATFLDSGLSAGAARPPHQNGIMVPSSLGWDSFYWDHSSPDADEQEYQRFGLNVWPAADSENYGLSDYMLECARRKALGVAAFAQALAEGLARLSSALGGTVALEDVIDVVELGNEGSHAWLKIDSSHPEYATYGAREAGRYYALIAGPLREAWPTLKFRVTELAGESDSALWSAHCDWLRTVVDTGMQEEVERWAVIKHFSDGSGSDGDEGAWLATQAAAGFRWPAYAAPTTPTVEPALGIAPRFGLGSGATIATPTWPWATTPFGIPPNVDWSIHVRSSSSRGPSDLRVSDLVHSFGFHFYHCHDTRGASDPFADEGWRDEICLRDQYTAFQADVVTPLIGIAGGTEIHIGELGIPAMSPNAPGADDDKYLANANDRYQAGLGVRRILTAYALGAASASWFTFRYGGTDPDGDWTDFMGMGLHAEAWASGAPEPADTSGYPRPIWFAIRRLNYLFSQCDPGTAEILYAQTGAVVIHLTAISTFTLDGETGKKYATVAWIDQYATDPFVNYADPLVRRYQGIQIQFGDADVVQGSLSPTVTPISGTDANGYQATDPPVWDDPLAYAAGTRVLSFFDSRFDVAFADPLTCPAPLLIFSDDDSPTIVDAG